MFWRLQCCAVSLAFVRPQWYWLDWNILQVIITTRLHAMHQRSRKILIFLIVTFLANNIFDGVAAIMTMIHASGGTLNCGQEMHGAHCWIPEEYILSGSYQCWIGFAQDVVLLSSIGWIFAIVWEVLTLCLAVWVAVKHFRELRRHSAGGIIGDCFTVLMKSHVLYFARWVHIVTIFPFFPLKSRRW
jgi:hypothetical protein